MTTGNEHLLGLAESEFLGDQVREAIDCLEAGEVRLVILDPAATCLAAGRGGSEAIEKNPLASYLRKSYQAVGEYGGFIVLQRLEAPSPR